MPLFPGSIQTRQGYGCQALHRLKQDARVQITLGPLLTAVNMPAGAILISRWDIHICIYLKVLIIDKPSFKYT